MNWLSSHLIYFPVSKRFVSTQLTTVFLNTGHVTSAKAWESLPDRLRHGVHTNKSMVNYFQFKLIHNHSG